MDNPIHTPATSTGRLFKTDSGRSRSMSEDRIKFVEEEYDFLSREIAAWLSGLVGEEVDANLVDSLRDGTILCRVVRDCLPNVTLRKFHENAEKTSFYAKDNVAIFAQACQEMGINKNDCMSASMFENGDRKQVVNAILRFAIVGIKYGLKPISVIHSERLKDFIEAMPEEVVPDMQSLVEKEIKEEQKQQIKEHIGMMIW
ncbi:calponin [Blastocystis sp. subtype 4]|uniref:calponin n=1 Tax=Blastocystis sp. subtype 4 TaxID=944170 RepID=UPI0007122528|nr:calponin [Blastocystis sp. subtype 4]KNB43862.1 calponin [Blastocystis sp. subtype 4]|eukprot:XP_014527305.1 calponin [Blastocystis sp. subtype 4]